MLGLVGIWIRFKSWLNDCLDEVDNEKFLHKGSMDKRLDFHIQSFLYLVLSNLLI